MLSKEISQSLRTNSGEEHKTFEQKLSLYMLDRQDILQTLRPFESIDGFMQMLDGIYAKSLLASWSNSLHWGDERESITPQAIASLRILMGLQSDFDSYYKKTDIRLPNSKRCIHAFSQLIQEHDFIYEPKRSDKIDSLLNKRFDCETITDLFIQLSTKHGLSSVGAVFSLELDGEKSDDYMPAIIEDGQLKFFYSYYLLFNSKDSENLNKDLEQICLFDAHSIPPELTFKYLEVIPDHKALLPSERISFTLRQRYFVLNELSHYIDDLDGKKNPQKVLKQGEQKYLSRWRKDPYDFSFFYACAQFYSITANLSVDREYKSEIAKSLTQLFTEGKDLYGEKMLRQSLPEYTDFFDSLFSSSFNNRR